MWAYQTRQVRALQWSSTHTLFDYAVRAINKEHNETAGGVYAA